MPKAWLLPEHTADVLPDRAYGVETLRRALTDRALGYGYDPVMPPLVEHIESLLTGTGHELDLRTVKVVDQISGRTLGIRADMTPQAARIDAHLLNRQGPVRLCYCGPVLHARPRALGASRDPLQFGAELYGHGGLEADLEVQQLALDCLAAAAPGAAGVDLTDVRIVEALLAGSGLHDSARSDLFAALAAKDRAGVDDVASAIDAAPRAALAALVGLYGPADEVIDAASRLLPPMPAVVEALGDLRWLAGHLRALQDGVDVGMDLAAVEGFGYYSGISFSVYAAGHADAVVRGGRYDGIGAVFGRRRSAVGFGLDVKELASLRDDVGVPEAIVAPWDESPSLREAIARLRRAGERVVVLLPGQESRLDELPHDRLLVAVGDTWVVRSA